MTSSSAGLGARLARRLGGAGPARGVGQGRAAAAAIIGPVLTVRHAFAGAPGPEPGVAPGIPAHPRLRRTSPITHYSAAVALEALGNVPGARNATFRLGLVVSLQTGCVHYCCRFYDESLRDPATASPLLFPETVFAAPGSHVASLLENVTLVYTLVGDPSAFLQAVALGVQWLEEERVDASLIIGAEESHWILADALRHLEREAVFAGGAGACA